MRIALLGATGSIGTSTLRVAEHHGIGVVALAAQRATPRLAELVRRLGARLVAVGDEAGAEALRRLGLPAGVAVRVGPEGLVEAACHPEADAVVVAVPGLAGLAPTLAALAAGRRVLTANKETLVAAGDLVAPHVASGRLLSVDSEHAAVAQLLGLGGEGLEELVLTASGGPFLHRSAEDLRTATLEEALAHPTWRMGPKVTIDSATLMNKGLEVIEAHVLFGLPYERIRVVVHPQSIVHALVRYGDGTWFAQLSVPDMALPIQWALLGGRRAAAPARPLDLTATALTFLPVPATLAPALRLAVEAGRIGGTRPAELNAANEVAVAAFCEGRIRFAEIVPLVERTLAALPVTAAAVTSLGDVLEADRIARRRACALVP
jgi:1-deoxy-D-xylulose-5-phosphate reductoisomerase